MGGAGRWQGVGLVDKRKETEREKEKDDVGPVTKTSVVKCRGASSGDEIDRSKKSATEKQQHKRNTKRRKEIIEPYPSARSSSHRKHKKRQNIYTIYTFNNKHKTNQV